jgi:hypothetical protein
MELAALITPAEDFIEREVRTGRDGFIAVGTTEGEAKALEDEFPGIYADAWTALEPEMRRYAKQQHPQLVERLARLFEKLLTPTEMAAVRTFYVTPTGQRILRTMYQNLDVSPMVNQIIADPEAKLSAETIAATQRGARAKVEAETGPADLGALNALMKVVPLAKMTALGEGVQALTAEFANEEDAEFDARIEKIATDAMEQYIAQRSPSGG